MIERQINKQNKIKSLIKLQARKQEKYVNQYITIKVSHFKSRNIKFLGIHKEIRIKKWGKFN